MEDKISKEIEEFNAGAKKMMENLSTFVNEIMDDLTPEQKEAVDKEMKKHDISNFQSELDKIKEKLKKDFKL